jgi:hypothetical protein
MKQHLIGMALAGVIAFVLFTFFKKAVDAYLGLFDE